MNPITKEGIKFYHIPKGTIVYRGNTDQYFKEGTFLNEEYEYFGLDNRVANIYGLVKSYIIEQDLLLYAMDNIHNVKQLYSIAPANIKKSITSTFGYSLGVGQIIRDSDELNDKIILSFICKQHMDGYGCNEIETDTLKNFHAEIAVCNPMLKVSLKEKEQYSSDYIEKAINKSKEKKMKLELERKRLQLSVRDSHRTPPRRPLFDDADDADDADDSKSISMKW